LPAFLSRVVIGVTHAASFLSLDRCFRHHCGTVLTPEDVETVLQLQAAGAFRLPAGAAAHRGTCSIPMAIHVVRRSNGTGGLEPEWIAQCIEDANAAFAPIGVSFYQFGDVDYIDSDALYTIDNSSESTQLRNTNRVPGAVNVYFVGNASFCGEATFTTPAVGPGTAIIRNSCTPRDNNHSTFTHELGHVFQLYHTHEPTFGYECVSGSNCATAGDLICDTPADPNVSGRMSSNCVYTGSITSVCPGEEGVRYNPPVHNYMSYADHYCRTEFTPMQYERMLATIMNILPQFGCGGVDCPADWDGDGGVNSADISAYLTAWLDSINDGTLAADVNEDQTVNSTDISAFLTMWITAVQDGC
jgi:hypothetical protein